MARRQIEDHSDADFVDAIDVEHEDASKIEKDARDEESEIQAHFGDSEEDTGMYFQVRKIVPESKDKPFCMEGTRADFPVLPKIQAKFGGGKYEVWIFKRKKLYRRMIVSVLAPNPEAVAASAPTNAEAIIAAIQSQSKLLEQVMSGPKQTGISLKEVLVLAPPIIAAIAPLFRAQQSQSSKEFMEMLATAKELFGEQEPREKSPLEMAGEIIAPMLAGMKPPETAPRHALPPAAPTPQQIQQAQMAQLKQQLLFMISRARKNSPPELYADVMEDTLPPEFLQMMLAPGAIDFLGTIEPGILTYRPWFEAVLAALASPPDDGDDVGDNEPRVSQPASPAFTTGYDAQRFGGSAPNFTGDDTENESGES